MPESEQAPVSTPVTDLFGVQLALPPFWAAVIALAVLVVAGLLLEYGLLRVLRRLAARTHNGVDDALLRGFTPVARTALILIAVDVVAQLFLVPAWRAVERRIVLTIGVVILSVQAWRLLNRVTESWMDTRPNLTALLPSVRLGLQIVLIPVVAITVLQIFEVPIMPLATTLGIGGLAVSLALQDVLKNVFAGIQIVLDQPVRVGERVELNNGRKGVVVSIGLRTTRIVTDDGRTIFVPNAIIANEPLVNWNAQGRDYVCREVLRIAGAADALRVRGIVEDEIEQMVATVAGVRRRRTVTMQKSADGDWRCDVEVLVDRNDHRAACDAVHDRVRARLVKESIPVVEPADEIVPGM